MGKKKRKKKQADSGKKRSVGISKKEFNHLLQKYLEHSTRTTFSTFAHQANCDIGTKMLWAFEQDKEAGAITIVPMNGDKVVIHGKREAEMFCNILTGHFR